MTEIQNSKQYDLEERTFVFARGVRHLIKELPNTTTNMEDGRQVIRASGSVGANYIEANEALSKKDFVYRIKVCLKESKESAYFLRLMKETNVVKFTEEIEKLLKEATELKKIFCAISEKSK